MDEAGQKQSHSSVGIFIAGVVVGGVGGGLAGWLLGGHLAPVLTGLLDLISRDSKHRSVRFEALQQ